MADHAFALLLLGYVEVHQFVHAIVDGPVELLWLVTRQHQHETRDKQQMGMSCDDCNIGCSNFRTVPAGHGGGEVRNQVIHKKSDAINKKEIDKKREPYFQPGVGKAPPPPSSIHSPVWRPAQCTEGAIRPRMWAPR